MMDFNDAQPQSSGGGDVIPEGTIAPVRIHLRGLVKSKTGGAQGLDVEYTVIAGSFTKRKAWGWHGVAGDGSDGHKQMVEITRSYIRGVLESAYGIDPADASDTARAARTLADWGDLDGVEFLARFKVEEGKEFQDGRTGEIRKGKPKNVLQAVTPDDPDYGPFKPAKPKAKGAARPTTNGSAKQPATASAGGGRPDWA